MNNCPKCGSQPTSQIGSSDWECGSSERGGQTPQCQVYQLKQENEQLKDEIESVEMLRELQEKVAVDSRKVACKLFNCLKTYAPQRITDDYLTFNPWLEESE